MLNGLTHRILGQFMSNLHKRQVYVGLLEILKDNKYYYHSKVGIDYSHLTEDGKAVVLDYINQVAPHMLKKDQEAIEALAKSMLWDELKK